MFALKKAFPKKPCQITQKPRLNNLLIFEIRRILCSKLAYGIIFGHLYLSLRVCCPKFVLHVYLCHCSFLAPYIKSTGSQQQQSVYSLTPFTCRSDCPHLSPGSVWCEHCEKYRSLLGWQLHSWDLNALFRCLYLSIFTTSCQPDLVLGQCP